MREPSALEWCSKVAIWAANTSLVTPILGATSSRQPIPGEASSSARATAVGGVISQGPTYFSLGTISLENPDNQSCPHWTWRGNVCSHTVYFTDLPATFQVMTSYYGSQM